MIRLEKEHFDRRQDQENGEEVQNPVELGDQLCPDTDHRTSEEQSANDAPEQHAVLVERRHREEAEDHRDHKDVVHAEGLLDDVAGQVLLRRHRTAVRQPVDRVHHHAKAKPLAVVGEVHEYGKRQPHGQPHGRPGEGLLDADDMSIAVKDAQVQCQHQQDKRYECYPDPHHSARASVVELSRLNLSFTCTASYCSPVRPRKTRRTFRMRSPACGSIRRCSAPRHRDDGYAFILLLV